MPGAGAGETYVGGEEANVGLGVHRVPQRRVLVVREEHLDAQLTRDAPGALGPEPAALLRRLHLPELALTQQRLPACHDTLIVIF